MKLVKRFLQTTYWQEKPVPVLISEGGNAKHVCSNYSQFAVDAMTFPFCGIAGYNQWEGWGKDQGDLRDITIRAQDHMNGVDVINTLSQGGGNWHPGRDRKTLKKKEYKDIYDLNYSEWRDFKDDYLEDYNKRHYSIEMQCYVSDDKNQIVGYIKNRTYNIFTKSIGGDCDDGATGKFPMDNLLNHRWNYKYYDGRLKISSLLSNKTYNIAFYGDKNGAIQYISFDSKLSSSSGRLKIRYPELWVEENWQNRPVVWFVAKKEGYNGMIKNNDFKESLLNTGLNIENDALTQNISLNIYPNPFKEYFTIESSIEDRILILELSGKVVDEQKISKGDNQIRTEKLTTGFYFIHCINQNRTFKLIKQ